MQHMQILHCGIQWWVLHQHYFQLEVGTFKVTSKLTSFVWSDIDPKSIFVKVLRKFMCNVEHI